MLARCSIPFFASDIPTEFLNLLVDDLRNIESGFPEFSNPLFIAGLKNEIHEARLDARKPFDWDSIPSAKNYEGRLKSRLLRERQRVSGARLGTDEYVTSNAPTGREPTFSKWKDDPGEQRDASTKGGTKFDSSQQENSATTQRGSPPRSSLPSLERSSGMSLLSADQLRTMLRCNKGIEEH
jgi:hypothetical protein